jgi:hypothetical protein
MRTCFKTIKVIQGIYPKVEVVELKAGTTRRTFVGKRNERMVRA